MIEQPIFIQRGSSSDLIVMIHGFSGSPLSYASVCGVIEQVADLENADFFIPAMPFGTFSRTKPANAVASIIAAIDKLWSQSVARNSPYERIYFIGHSMGGLFVRKAYVCATGTHPDAPIESEYDDALSAVEAPRCGEPRPWASHVERIVLLAALNRGWSISHHLGFKNALLWSFGSLIGHFWTYVSRSDERHLVFAMRRGSPFITQLRVQWIRMRQRAASGDDGQPGSAVTVQLLGSVDDMVSPEDSVDIVAGGDFYYIDVPFSSHASILDMTTSSEEGVGRAACLVTALTYCAVCLDRETVRPADEGLTVREDVTDVVFVIHGIRDTGYWTQKISRRAIARGAQLGRIVASETSTYGYFPMLPFILPGTRRKKVEWLMDEYAEAVARYPNAEFAYMGHSNGTYMLAAAIIDYPVARFTNVVFAGSVVTTDYDWSTYIASGRIGAVLNYTASSDAVVAFFPKLFQKPRWQDLGSAGHDGFDQARTNPRVKELGPIKGGHSAARQESEWDSIATFLIEGTAATPSTEAGRRNRLVAALGRAPIVVWVLIISAMMYGGAQILRIPAEGWRVFAFILYGVILWRVVTRV